MALADDDRAEIVQLIGDTMSAAQAANANAIASMVDRRVDFARFGGPTVQVSPTDLVYLGAGSYVSQATGHVYKKDSGRLVDMGAIPEPV